MSVLLTLSQDGNRRDMIMSDGMLNRLVNVHSAYHVMADTLQWIVAQADAPQSIRDQARLALQSMDGHPMGVPFDA